MKNILTWKPERKRPLCGLRCRWDDSIKIDFKN